MDSRFLSPYKISAIYMGKVIAVFYHPEAEIDSKKILLISDFDDGYKFCYHLLLTAISRRLGVLGGLL